MGRVIMPAGNSIECSSVEGSILYETIVREMLSDNVTSNFRCRSIKILSAVGLKKPFREQIMKFLKILSVDADTIELRDLARETIELKKKKKKVSDDSNASYCG